MNETRQAPRDDTSPAAQRGAEARPPVRELLKSAGAVRRFRSLGWLLPIVLVVALGLWLRASTSDGTPTQRYVTAAARVADIVVIVSATGTVEPTDVFEISSELSGTIKSVSVEANERVTSEQVLARLDTAALEAAVAHGRASVASREARVGEADATLEERDQQYARTRTLRQREVATEEALLSARAALKRAEAMRASALADVEVDRATLALDEANLAKACICSPVDGVVLARDVEPGQIVAASFQAPVLFTIAGDLERMELRVDIDEADIGEVSVGDPATFTVEAWRERRFPATIERLMYQPRTIDGVVTYEAILQVDNAAMLLRPGMTATADVTVAEIDAVLAIPNAALRYAPPAQAEEDSGSGLLGMLFSDPPSAAPITSNASRASGERTIHVLREGTPVAIQVFVGQSDGELTEILDGDLAEGEPVVVDERLRS